VSRVYNHLACIRPCFVQSPHNHRRVYSSWPSTRVIEIWTQRQEAQPLSPIQYASCSNHQVEGGNKPCGRHSNSHSVVTRRSPQP